MCEKMKLIIFFLLEMDEKLAPNLETRFEFPALLLNCFFQFCLVKRKTKTNHLSYFFSVSEYI